MMTIYIHASSMIFSGVRIHCRIFLHRSTVTIVSTTAKITDTHALLATQRRIPLSSFAPNLCAIGIANPLQIPIQNPIIKKLIEPVEPTAAS